MAVTGNFNEGEGKITITNGDLAALKKIAREYDISDAANVIKFAIRVLSRASGKAVSVEQEDGTSVKFLPSDQVRGK
jgi:hypothetical protein